MDLHAPAIDRLEAWILAREALRLRREANGPLPWTDDPILATYRFCNVRREDDRVTRWVATHWRTPHATDPNLPFAMVVARLLNLPESLAAVGYPTVFRPGPFHDVLQARMDSGERVFNGAYIVSTNGHALPKLRYLVDHVLSHLWAKRIELWYHAPDCATLAALHGRLLRFAGLGSFMAAQVVADVKYVAPWQGCADWRTFAASGPGSKRGLNRVCNRPVNAPWREVDWHATLSTLLQELDCPLLDHAQDLQNCLCEFDKYERVRLGEGAPKQRYTPDPTAL